MPILIIINTSEIKTIHRTNFLMWEGGHPQMYNVIISVYQAFFVVYIRRCYLNYVLFRFALSFIITIILYICLSHMNRILSSLTGRNLGESVRECACLFFKNIYITNYMQIKLLIYRVNHQTDAHTFLFLQ